MLSSLEVCQSHVRYREKYSSTSSIFRIRRPVLRHLSIYRPHETTHVSPETSRSLRGSRPRSHVRLYPIHHLTFCPTRADISSASAMAMVKCTQLDGLANKEDYTCLFISSRTQWTVH